MATTNKVSKKVIKVENIEGAGQRFSIYEVRVRKIADGETWTSDRYLSKEAAEETAELYRESFTHLYDAVYVMEHSVWVK